MNTFVADPQWGWWIILYFYLGGIAAGAFFMATLIELFGGEEDEGLARAGYLVAFPLISLCGIFVVLCVRSFVLARIARSEGLPDEPRVG